MHIMARQIQTNETLEDHGVSWFGRSEEDEQASGGAAIGHHVEDGAEAGALLKFAGGDAVDGVEEAGDAVEEAAAAGVEGHEVQAGKGEEDAGIAWS